MGAAPVCEKSLSVENMQPKVTVILPCRNEALHIEHCLNSICQQQQPEGGFEIIIADGMSDDGTREILARLEKEISGPKFHLPFPVSGFDPQPSPINTQPPRCGQVVIRPVVSGPLLRLIDNPGRIVSTGLNVATRAACGQVIVRMDAHTDYAPDYICRCLEALERTGADNVGGPARTKAESSMHKAIAAAYHSPFSVGGARFHDVNYEGSVDTVTYGCWPRSTFQKVGLFDEELVRNQDDEHNLRIVRGGGKIFQSPKIKSWYKPRSSLPGLFKQYMQYGYWKVRVIQKHKLPASWRHLVPASFLVALALLFLLSAFGFPLSACGCISLIVVYILGVLAASAITAAKTEWKLLPLLALVFPCYHFGYGLGFLQGIWDFVIGRKGARKSFSTLTR